MSSINEPGSLAFIARAIGETEGNIDNIKMVRRGHDAHDMLIDLEVYDVKHLNEIIAQVRLLPNVTSVARVNG